MKYLKTLYIDPTISSAGNGSTPATALKQLPGNAEFAADCLYVIRRTSTALSIMSNGPSENSTTVRLGIWAMPKSTDRWWSLVPQEARDAWGSDPAIMPIIKSNGMNRFNFSACRDFSIMGINLEMIPESYESYDMFSLTNSSPDSNGKYGETSIEYCKMNGGNDWESDWNQACSYISVSHCGRLRICNNDIFFAGSSGYGPGGNPTGITISKTYEDALIQNNIIRLANYTSGGYGGGGDINYESFALKINYYEPKDVGYVGIINNEIKIYLKSDESSPYTGGGIYFGGYAMNLEVKKFKAVEEKILAAGTKVGISAPLLYVNNVEFMANVDGINVNIPHIAAYSSYGLIRIDGYGAKCLAKSVCKNITIVGGTSNNDLVFISDGSGSGNDDAAKGHALRLKNINAQNVSIDCPNSKAIYLDECRVVGAKMNGCAWVRNSSLEADSLTYNRTTLSPVTLSYCSMLTINKINVPEAFSKNVIEFDNWQQGTQAYVNECNKALRVSTAPWTTSYSDGYDTGGIWCSSNGAVGRFACYSPIGFADTWGAVRQGSSANASIRMQSKSASAVSPFFTLAPYPGSLLFSESVASGSHIAKIYFAAYEMTNPEDKIVFEIETDNGIYMDGSIETTEDKWTGCGNVTSYCFKCPIECTGQTSISGRIKYLGFGENPTLFIDPIMIIE